MEAQRCLRIRRFIGVKMSLSVSASREISQALHRAFSSRATPEPAFCLNFLSSTYILRYSFLSKRKCIRIREFRFLILLVTHKWGTKCSDPDTVKKTRITGLRKHWWNCENDCYLNIGKPQVIFMQRSNINRSQKSKRDGNDSANSYWEYVPQLCTCTILEEKYFTR